MRDDSYFLSKDKIFPPDMGGSAELINESPNTLDLTDFWDPRVYLITPTSGNVKISTALFIEKDTIFNYGYREGAPGGVSTLMWNSVESIYEFGSHELKPGDLLVFTETIDMGDKFDLLDSKHGDGYFGNTNGMCNAATALSELFGTQIVLPNGSTVPLFIAKPGDVQSHDMNHNPSYYNYAYHSAGVAVNNTPSGSLPFMVNPNLPKNISVELSMSFYDSNPQDPYDGVYKPIASVDINNLPNGYKILFQRLSANRTTLLQKMTGSTEYYLPKSKSAYFDKQGSPIISKSPIVFEVKKQKNLQPTLVINPESNLTQIQLERFKSISVVPENMANEFIYPGGFAHRSIVDKNGQQVWNTKDEWLPLNTLDLPKPIESVKASEYLRILRWNNVENLNNIRYKMDAKSGTTYCIVAITDWAAAYRFGQPQESVPLPRWLDGNKLTSNALFDWLHSYQADALGWQQVTSKEASEFANKGSFTLVIAKNLNGNGHIAAVSPGIGWTSPEGTFYPNTSQVGFENWGPDAGKTAYDSFLRATANTWTAPQYFVWQP